MMNRVVEERRKSRKYDILLLGATGYTGLLTAEYIVRHLPVDLKWAIAGRSKSKLEGLSSKLKDLDPERVQPGKQSLTTPLRYTHHTESTKKNHIEIEVVEFDDLTQLGSVVKNSKVCISVVLYWQVGEVVVKSCIENGTDYIDVAGDIPLLRTFIDRYHDAAVNASIALIHLCGVFSGPQDLLTWAAARELAQKTSLKTKELVFSITEFEAGMSGGTASSLLAESTHDPRVVEEAKQPWVLSPIKRPKTPTPADFLGMRKDPTLGLLSASSFGAIENRALVHRTWALLQDTDQGYGPNFRYNEYIKVSSAADGLLHILTLVLMRAALKFGPSRRILRLILPKPGEGPDIEKERSSRVKFEAIAIADMSSGSAPRAYASFSYPSGGYHTTGLLLAQAAASLLYTRNLAGRFSGGCLTPAFLGEDFWRRIQEAGAVLQVNMV
ncbi:Saccharopine dehydrogenase-domain-containing protein [Daldinia decipiens]|uniref:Saccharopine dehydrogenase-domain-containing protein n=1 Tax=Daldinia decipiens TaxID=326647 RepID=UPI0020C5B18A|nr:Saccharopine dehydrogenase-domain-containing protein [Daldinia decipiens]KAI1653990.1 Saccharopine dehydrogenase-domain-containing protein [Daldinia decipiens]